MTHSVDINEIKKELEAFLDKHYDTLMRSDAASYIDDAIESLGADINHQAGKESEEPSFDLQAHLGTWNKTLSGVV